MIIVPIIVSIIIVIYSLRKRKKERRFEVDELIRQKYEELRRVESEIVELKHDTALGLTKDEISVLDIYERSGIRIPTDIIEDLHHMKLESSSEMFNYIENQRYFWKLENTKKVYKGGK